MGTIGTWKNQKRMMGFKFQNTEYDKYVNKSKQQEDDCELRVVI